jgi:YidC/Oxa1 family membrane protein insertase
MWETYFIQPILNALIAFYNLVGDMGLAIILLTIAIQLLLAPLYKKQIESQKALKEIQPKMKEIQKKHKDDKEKQSKELLKLYQEEGVNPAGGCLPLLIQFPIFIAVYYVFRSYINVESLDLLYSFISRPEILDTNFLGILDMTATGSIYIALVAGITTYFQIVTMPGQQEAEKKDKDKKEDDKSDFSSQLTTMMSKQMKGFMPIMSFVIVLQFPAAIGVYWTTRNLFTLAQNYLIKNGDEKVKVKVKEKK